MAEGPEIAASKHEVVDFEYAILLRKSVNVEQARFVTKSESPKLIAPSTKTGKSKPTQFLNNTVASSCMQVNTDISEFI